MYAAQNESSSSSRIVLNRDAPAPPPILDADLRFRFVLGASRQPVSARRLSESGELLMPASRLSISASGEMGVMSGDSSLGLAETWRCWAEASGEHMGGEGLS